VSERHESLVFATEQWLAKGWGDPNLMTAVSATVRVERLLSAMMDTALRPIGLTFPRFEALAALYFSPDQRMALGKMSERLQVHPATITSIIDRLELQELVERVRPEGDRRVVLAQLLPEGVKVVEQAVEVIVNEVFPQVPWTSDEVDELAELLVRFRQRVGKPA
jgi:DNA-binding MarR family transcriptional regulator